MVVVSIVAILAALAGPSFTPLIENWRVRESAEQLQSTLYYARSEAIKRGGQVVIQKIPNNTNGCTSATGSGSIASSTVARRVMLPVCQCSSWRPVIRTIG